MRATPVGHTGKVGVQDLARISRSRKEWEGAMGPCPSSLQCPQLGGWKSDVRTRRKLWSAKPDGRLADWQCTGVAEIEVGNGLRQLKRTGTGTSPGDSCSVGPDLVGLVGFVRCRCATVLMVSWVR